MTSVALEIEVHFLPADAHGGFSHGNARFIKGNTVAVLMDLLHDLVGKLVTDEDRILTSVSPLLHHVNEVALFEVGVRAEDLVLTDKVKDCPVLFETFVSWCTGEREFPLRTFAQRSGESGLCGARFLNEVSFVSDDHQRATIVNPVLRPLVPLLAQCQILDGLLVRDDVDVALPVVVEVLLDLLLPRRDCLLWAHDDQYLRLTFINDSQRDQALPCALLRKKRETAVGERGSNGFALVRTKFRPDHYAFFRSESGISHSPSSSSTTTAMSSSSPSMTP